MLKNFKIKEKFLISIFLIVLVSCVLLLIVSITGFIKMKIDVQNLNTEIMNKVLNSSSNALNSQNIDYINKIASIQSKKYNEILFDVKSNILNITDELEDIYSLKTADFFKSSKIKTGALRDTKNASGKIYFEGIKNSYILKEMDFLSKVEPLARSIYMCNNIIESVCISTESGIFYRYSTNNNFEKFNYKNRQWYVDAIDNAKDGKDDVLWHKAYEDASNDKLCITASKAFKDDSGKILGVVCIDTFIDTIYDEILSNNEAYNEIVFFKDENEIIGFSKNFNDNIKSQLLNNLDDVNNDLILIDGTKYFVSKFKVEEIGWDLYILSDESAFFSLTNNISTDTKNIFDSNLKNIDITITYFVILTVTLFIIILIISFFIAKFLSKKITIPLNNLAKEARKIGKGALKRKININSKDEIGDLANSFNKMTKDLVIYMRNFKKTVKEKEKINSELKIAKKIQKSLLPDNFSKFKDKYNFDIFASMSPAKMVGGDFYDFFLVDEDHIAIVIGDVSDKGIAAALFMVVVKTLIKNQAMNGFSPNKIFNLVNNQLIDSNDAGMFVTVFMGILNIKTGDFVYSNAGHNKPLIYKSGDGLKWLDTDSGFVLAGISNMEYKLEKIKLNKGDMIYLYTDGVTEALDLNNNLFTNSGLTNALKKMSLESLDSKAIILELKKDLKDFSNGAEQSDDITMLLLKYGK